MQVADDTPRIDDWLEFEALAAEVRRAVEDLPERQRTVVIMRNFEDMPGAEIAETLGCSHQAVRSLLCRAYATLRERLVDFQPSVQ